MSKLRYFDLLFMSKISAEYRKFANLELELWMELSTSKFEVKKKTDLKKVDDLF